MAPLHAAKLAKLASLENPMRLIGLGRDGLAKHVRFSGFQNRQPPRALPGRPCRRGPDVSRRRLATSATLVRGDARAEGHKGGHAPPPSGAQAGTPGRRRAARMAVRRGGSAVAATPTQPRPRAPGSLEIWRTCEPSGPRWGMQTSQARQSRRPPASLLWI